MAEKGPPKSWKSHDFPERFKTTSGTKAGKNDKKKWIRSFWDTLGQPVGMKMSFQGGLKKRLHFCHEFDQMLSRFLIKMSCFFTCVFESLNLFPNQHKMYGTKLFCRKGCMYANHMIYRVERVCATSLRTGTWPKKKGNTRMCVICRFIVISMFSRLNLCTNFWWYFELGEWLPKLLQNRCQNR